jgi:DNA-binding NtrC family response regulator
MNVLLVDDEAMMRKMVKIALQKNGFQVFDAATGADALALAQAHRIDVLVTDVVMDDDMDGWSLASSLVERYPRLPVVFMSGYPTDLANKRQEYARCTFLAKPFQPGDLMQAISWVLAARAQAADNSPHDRG